MKTTLEASYTNVATGFTVNFTGQIVGQATSSYLDFGDGTVLSNLTFQSNIAHAWVTGGNYTVTLTAYNDSNPGGVSAITVVLVAEGISYVRLDSSNPVAPYTSWATAATNIQDAVDAAFVGGTVLVTNGVYVSGGRPANGYALTNRLTVDKPLTIQSINGPAVTIIQGYQVPTNIWGDSAVRCAYLENGVMLGGFMLTNGATRMAGETSGGGAYCDGAVTLTNCILIGNSAAGFGGGAYEGTLNNCTLSGNSATNTYGGGGGADFSTLNNCTLSNNSACYGGGAYYCTFSDCTLSSNTAIGPYGSGGGTYYGTLTNCTLSGNSASHYGGGASKATLNHCNLNNNSSAYEGGGAYNTTLNICILSSNSAYEGGGAYNGTLNNCTLSNNSAGYEGGGAGFSTLNNCILSGNSAVGNNANGGGASAGTLNNCTLSGNSASYYGGGAAWANLNNCTLSNNSSTYDGGGAYTARLNNCVLINNSTTFYGGGAYGCEMTNCTLSGNSVNDPTGAGGGVLGGTLNNCLVYYNRASSSANYASGSLCYCCTTPMPSGGPGNITNAPLFVDTNGWSNLRLQSNSPCINSGNNAFVANTTDLDGNSRIVGATVDIGAYEYQTPTSVISYAWLQQYGLPINGSVDYKDLDGTGFNVYQDWIAGLNPTDALSVLAMLSPVPTNNPAGLVLSWESVSNRTYFLQSSTNWGAQPAFFTIQSNILGQTGATSYTDTNAVGNGPIFYRVGVQQ
ncbi:MAG TPA: choice-of-anchor Q domain-containing protein [Verrucomicrobiae bacterium]|nr:choice-of-anchor Q domain-containing protein [Verrucomicrobiae bacterium]